MEIVSDPDKTEEYQQEFKEILVGLSSGPCEATVGFQGDSMDIDVYYLKELDFWSGFRVLHDEPVPRFWNAFGLGNPYEVHNNEIVVEINFAFAAGDMRVAGALVADDTDVLVCHSGKIGGGREGIGKNGFWNNYQGESIEVEGYRLANIGRISSPDLPGLVRDFVREVKRIKDGVSAN